MTSSSYYTRKLNFHRQERDRARAEGQEKEALKHEKEAVNYKEMKRINDNG